MELKEAMDRLAVVEAENKRFKSEIEASSAETKKLTENLASATKTLSEKEKEKKAVDIKSFTDEMVKEGKVLTAQVASVTSVLEALDDTTKGIKMLSQDGKTEEQVSPFEAHKRYIRSLPKILDFKEKTETMTDDKTKKTDEELLKEFKEGPVETKGSVESQKLHFLTENYMKSHDKMSYEDALIAVSREHEDLVMSPNDPKK